GPSAFSHCHDLTSITIPNSVTEIDSRAFSYINHCIKLYNIYICTSYSRSNCDIRSLLIQNRSFIEFSDRSCLIMVFTPDIKLIVCNYRQSKPAS
ncbi:leucine-rich repeat protein, partial [bacterium]|nr:leucine-rich repeat protein [bacterium]